MKYLVLLVILVVAYMLWRNARLARRDDQATPPPPPAAAAPGGPQDMIRCPVCAVHLPRADAVADASGALYCSQEHRLLGGG